MTTLAFMNGSVHRSEPYPEHRDCWRHAEIRVGRADWRIDRYVMQSPAKVCHERHTDPAGAPYDLL
jgi:hypothetical protein